MCDVIAGAGLHSIRVLNSDIQMEIIKLTTNHTHRCQKRLHSMFTHNKFIKEGMYFAVESSSSNNKVESNDSIPLPVLVSSNTSNTSSGGGGGSSALGSGIDWTGGRKRMMEVVLDSDEEDMGEEPATKKRRNYC